MRWRAHRPSQEIDRSSRASLRFNARELAGGLGDMGTFLPLTLGLAIATDMSLAPIFIGAGLMNIASGWLFRQPLPVQPMKAIAAAAIAERLTAGEVAAAGLFVGAIVLVLSIGGVVGWMGRIVPRPLVRGIQAGIGMKLVLSGLAIALALEPSAWDGPFAAALVAAVLLIARGARPYALLGVFGAGLMVVVTQHPDLIPALPPASFTVPRPTLPTADEWLRGGLRAGVAQFPLTLLNSVIAVCALSTDYFPKRGITTRRMGVSVGLMNLLAVPFGAMPMCHGAGGLAAQYSFGARTGGSVVMVGALKVTLGLVCLGGSLAALEAYPASILAVMLIFAGLTLTRAARDTLVGRPLVIMAATALGVVFIHTLGGFLLGVGAVTVLHLLDRSRKATA